MKLKLFIIYLLLSSDIYSNNIKEIYSPIKYHKQKNVYENFKKNQVKKPIYTKLQPIKLSKNDKNENCVKIKKIELLGNTLLDKRKITPILNKYQNRCDTLSEINNIVKKINNLYIKKGYITSQAYLKPQKLSSGILTIYVMEGKIEDVIDKNVNSSLIVRGLKGNNFNLREIELFIEQLNRLSSKKVTMDINPGKKEGYSTIILKGQDISSPLKGYIGTDNYSYGNFKKYQINGALTWENPLGIQDVLNVTLNVSNKYTKTNKSVGSGFSYGLPIYKSYIEFGYNIYKYITQIEGLNKKYISKSNTKSYFIKGEYKIFHTQHHNGKINVEFNHKKVDNYLDSILLDTTSYKINTIKLSYTHDIVYPKYTLTAMLGYEKSLSASFVNKKETKKEDLLFHKILFSLNGKYKFTKEQYPITLTSTLYGQYAPKNTIASEQIGIGGPYSVRGFKSAHQLSSNFGLYLRNELYKDFSINKKVSITPYLGLDLGWAKKNKFSNGGKIMGATIGSRFNIYGLNIDIFASKAIKDSSRVRYLKNGDKEVRPLDKFLGINISYRF